MRPLKVAILHNHRNGSFRVRCQAPTAWLQKQGAIEVVPPLHAWTADVVILHNQWHPGADALVRSFKRHGLRVVADLDEDIFSASAQHQTHVRQLLGVVDATFVPTEHLAEKIASLSSNISITPNGVDLADWRSLAKPRPEDRVRVVGFAGTSSHSANLDMLRPALAKLASKFKEQDIRFISVGCRPPWLADVMPGAEIVDPCTADTYAIRLAALQLDVALAPLGNSEFDQSRSALKIWEYTAAGAVTIASNVDPYASAIQDGATGLLVDNRPELWVQAITKLIRNHELRRELHESAQRAVEAHDISRTAPAMLAALEATNPNRNRALFSLPRTQTLPRVAADIVIPIYDSPALTKQAIESALPELDDANRLILADDASPDPAIGALLDEYQDRPWVTIHRSGHNRGFVGTCNFAVRELARPGADVILMNADTRPMPGFARRLGETAGSNPVIGTVTAVSNEGWIASVPAFRDATDLAGSEHDLILSPTACGFLFYIKREVIDKYGLFDTAFAPGYCEEVDLSQRISREYVNVIDPGCWTWHANSASFGDSKFKLSADHNAIIDQRYPQFRFELAGFNARHPLEGCRSRMLRATRDPRPRVLHVLQTHGSGHGTGKHVRDLGISLSDQFLSLAAAATESRNPAQERLELFCAEVPIRSWPYTQPGWPQTAAQIPANDQAWDNLVNEVKPSLIHFHHLKNHTLNLLVQLVATRVPVIVSLHDYYFLCPDFALQECPGVRSCDSCYPKRFRGPSQYQQLRRSLFHASLKLAAAIIAPSNSAAALVREAYPDLNIRVVPHGIRPVPQLVHEPRSKVRFGMLGNVNAVKGVEVILKAWPMVTGRDAAQLHVYGISDRDYTSRFAAAGIHYHGPYSEHNLPRILSQMDIGVLPSQAPETFSYTLSEFFAGGVPVIGSDFGALGERIENGVNGFKIAKDDVRSWASVLSRLIQDAALRERITRGVRAPGSIGEMALQYAELYSGIIDQAQQGSAAQKPEAGQPFLVAPEHELHAAR